MFQKIFGQYSRKESFVSFDLFVLFLSESLNFSGLQLSTHYIFHFKFSLLLVHLSNFFPFSLFFQLQFLLPVLHHSQLLLLKHLHSTDFKDSTAEYIQEWLDFVVKIKQLIVPDLCLPAIRKVHTHRQYCVVQGFCA